MLDTTCVTTTQTTPLLTFMHVKKCEQKAQWHERCVLLNLISLIHFMRIFRTAHGFPWPLRPTPGYSDLKMSLESSVSSFCESKKCFQQGKNYGEMVSSRDKQKQQYDNILSGRHLHCTTNLKGEKNNGWLKIRLAIVVKSSCLRFLACKMGHNSDDGVMLLKTASSLTLCLIKMWHEKIMMGCSFL